MTPSLQLSTLQNWSCHNCGGCCRQHEIEITAAERERIESQNWTAEDGVGPGPVIESIGGWLVKRRWRLAHQADGACVFLDERGLCRIHARFGEPAKPLACRLYPFAFHPKGNQAVLGFRFSCPSVVANRGRSPREQISDLRELERLVVPPDSTAIAPPPIHGNQQLDWNDTLRIVRALDLVLQSPGKPVVLKLLWSLGTVDLIGRSSFERVRGDRLEEYLEVVTGAVQSELSAVPKETAAPSATARQLFRMAAAQYARRDTLGAEQQGWGYRWFLLRSIWKFATGRGLIPPLQPGFVAVPFDDLESPIGGLPPESEEVLTRYLRVKVQSLHFCGPAYYGVPVVEGFAALGVAVVVMLYLARWLARGDGRDQWRGDDISRAMSFVDHHHGYSPALGLGSFRARLRLLWRQKEVTRLLAWYAR